MPDKTPQEPVLWAIKQHLIRFPKCEWLCPHTKLHNLGETRTSTLEGDKADAANHPQDCTQCDGQGWTAEHHPFDHDAEGACNQSCPVQVPCEPCLGTGKVFATHPPDKHQREDTAFTFLGLELRHTLKLIPMSQRELFLSELARWYVKDTARTNRESRMDELKRISERAPGDNQAGYVEGRLVALESQTGGQ